MEIRSVLHKGLRRLIEEGETSGVPGAYAAKREAIVAFLLAAPNAEAIRKLQTWKAHPLTGDRKGYWSLSVSRNWRLTFRISKDDEIENLDFEDYH
jgi:proteic killer suppression protein